MHEGALQLGVLVWGLENMATWSMFSDSLLLLMVTGLYLQDQEAHHHLTTLHWFIRFQFIVQKIPVHNLSIHWEVFHHCVEAGPGCY